MTDFLTLSYNSTTQSLPFYIPEAWKGYPFWLEPPHIGYYREYPPPPNPGFTEHTLIWLWSISVDLASNVLDLSLVIVSDYHSHNQRKRVSISVDNSFTDNHSYP